VQQPDGNKNGIEEKFDANRPEDQRAAIDQRHLAQIQTIAVHRIHGDAAAKCSASSVGGNAAAMRKSG